ncbi:GW domain-containing glycosaminoglycan-binding protein [Listeria ivanovii]|nr:GW domain-containing glycosaminoglycan-binding protein [Listeria ivanovii]
MRKNNWLKNVLIGMLVTLIVTCVNISQEIKVQAASISNPMPINQIFPDTNLAEVMKWSLRKNSVTDVVSQQELDQVESINAMRENIKSIQGLQHLSNLQTIYLSDNQIQDISYLTNLNKLEEIYLSGNQIKDIGHLANLNKLEKIFLQGNQLTDINLPAGLSNLKTLVLSNNQIKDICNLEKSKKLENVYLQGNQLTDISIAGLSNLNILDLSNNQIKGINQLANLNKLNELYLEGNQLTDISVLAGLSNLKTLNLNNNQIKDIRTLSTLVNLENLLMNNNQLININHLSSLLKLKLLSFNGNRVTDISSVAKLTNLTELDCSENQVDNINSLAKLTNLTGLTLEGNKVKDLSPLAQLTNLTGLNFRQNQINDISILEKLPNLDSLAFDKNKVSDISILAKLPKLTYLIFNDNQVTNIDSLAKLPHLVGVDFSGNKVSNIKALTNLTKLRFLNANGNCIQDIQALRGLTQLEELKLARNRIMDISPLIWLNNIDELDLSNQAFINRPIDFQVNVTIPNIVKDITGTLIAPNSSSDKVTYNPPNLTWNLPTYKKEVCYTFNQSVMLGQATSQFSGQVIQPFNKLDVVKSNKAITAYGRVKPGKTSTVWTQPCRTKDTKQVGMVSAYTGKNLRILREAQTTSGIYYQFSVGGKTIGWVEAQALGIFYQSSMEKKATGARYTVRGKEGQHFYKLPVIDAAIDGGTLAKWKGKRLIIQREVTIGKEKWLLLQGVGWVKATNLTTVLYNKPMTGYAKVKLAKGKVVWSNPYNITGYKVVASLSRYTGKNLRILREAQTSNGLYYQVRVGKKTIGWVEAKNVAVFYKPIMEKKYKGTRFVNVRKKNQAYYSMPVADAAISRGKLQKFGRKRVTIDRKATIQGQQWYRIKGAGWTKAVNLSTRR